MKRQAWSGIVEKGQSCLFILVCGGVTWSLEAVSGEIKEMVDDEETRTWEDNTDQHSLFYVTCDGLVEIRRNP